MHTKRFEGWVNEYLRKMEFNQLTGIVYTHSSIFGFTHFYYIFLWHCDTLAQVYIDVVSVNRLLRVIRWLSIKFYFNDGLVTVYS